ncbi:heterokaryon incompatibility protein-domain-containing protein [Hypoxylon cercidicola]|nr:heterokaryon incompatibility protein-domain-containing protein [Hypoxylon cercidicola]
MVLNTKCLDEETTRQIIARTTARGMDEYNYDDCPLQKGRIRILLLKPDADRNGDIVVELLSCSIDELARIPDYYPFTALSYNWGDEDASRDVFVGMGADNPKPESDEITKLVTLLQRRPKRFKVKPTLHEFLREFRDSTKEVGLWVDCFCINQKDSQEKSDQVSKIATVYSTAAKVSIWLGPADEDGKTDRAMDFIRSILQAGTGEIFTRDYARAWSELIYLMRRTWFSRRWMVQEVALAKEAEVRCGSKRIHWRDFSDAVSIFTLNFDTILKIIKSELGLDQCLEGITDMRPLNAQILVDLLSNPLQSLESLASSLSTFSVSDPRDTVYTLLSLAKENSKLPQKPKRYALPEPDYGINLLQVYTKFVQWCVQESESLDILCRHWAFPELEHTLNNEDYPELVKLPSWIKTVDDPARGAQKQGFGGRRTGDSFVGTPESCCYNASPGMSPTISYGIDQIIPIQKEEQTNGTSEGTSEEIAVAPLGQQMIKISQIHLVKRPQLDLSTSITVRGRCIGRIIKPSLMPKGIIPKQVLQSLGYESGSTELISIPDALWRTLVADRGPDGKPPPSRYHRACMICLVDDTKSGHMDTNRILQQDANVKLKADFVKRVQAVCWNRAFIDCGQDDAENRLVGIGPGDSQANDLVCILYGLSVPCILRPTWRGGGDDYTPDYYELVGEAFILGQMDGEGIVDLSEEELRGQEFRIM